ncbi:hypothetical protein HYH03_007577 [Edaphochlamys debaryana]|uniref:Protein kinase domain-containing protein n=1 Tax=Edaphochlamys debaryana TaxID=47281 RepID=A0A835Y1J2_9CHLO|nr:hypothetical protein HYH03_007577 [Edaphochlamys debaryana]|eukprot:KAG2494221.1 hypothetical protein HYH03_007577 [Edaphochlamys debaryana]
MLLFCGESAALQAGRTLQVYTGVDLATAFVDETVGVGEISVPFLNATADEFDSVLGTNAVYVLRRNFTLAGSRTLREWPLVVVTARARIQLADGVALRLTELIAYRHRRDNGARMPGSDLLAPSAPGTRGALLLQEGSSMILDFCYNKTLAQANYAAITRPAAIPGSQDYEIFARQEGCTDPSSTDLLTQRCYAGVIQHTDFAVPAAEPDGTGKPVYAWYNAWLRDSQALCLEILTSQCIEEYGALGCFLVALRGAGSQPLLLPWLQQHDRIDPSSEPAPGEQQPGDTGPGRAPSGGSALTPVGQGQDPAGGGGSSDAATVGLAVGVAVGGTLVLVGALAAAVLLWRRKAGAQAQARGKSLESEPPDGSRTAHDKSGSGLAKGSGGGGACNGCASDPFPCPYSDRPQDPDLESCVPDCAADFAAASVPRSADADTERAPHTPAPPPVVVTWRTPFHKSFTAHATLVVVSDDRGLGGGGAGSSGGGGGGAGGGAVPLAAGRPHSVQAAAEPGRLGSITTAAFSAGSGVLQAGAEERGPGPCLDTDGWLGCAAGSAAGGFEGSESERDVVELLPLVLGKGAFGRVQEGRYRGQVVAVKLILSAEDVAAGDACALTAALAQELEVLARCQHPNIVRLLAACVEPPRPFCVLERMETSLDKVLYGKAPGPDCAGKGGSALLPLPMVLHIAREIARGLDFLHPTIMHRDLKPANCLLNDPWGPNPVVKISDFGLARLRETMLVTCEPEAGTAAYLAPECFDVASSGCLTHRADMWSFGVLLWEMLAGVRPWQGMAPVPIAIQVTMWERRLPMPLTDGPGSDLSRWPRRPVRLIASCWERDPQRRPAAAEVVKQLTLMMESDAGSVQRSGSLRNSSTGPSHASSTSMLRAPDAVPAGPGGEPSGPPGPQGLGPGPAAVVQPSAAFSTFLAGEAEAEGDPSHSVVGEALVVIGPAAGEAEASLLP